MRTGIACQVSNCPERPRTLGKVGICIACGMGCHLEACSSKLFRTDPKVKRTPVRVCFDCQSANSLYYSDEPPREPYRSNASRGRVYTRRP